MVCKHKDKFHKLKIKAAISTADYATTSTTFLRTAALMSFTFSFLYFFHFTPYEFAPKQINPASVFPLSPS